MRAVLIAVAAIIPPAAVGGGVWYWKESQRNEQMADDLVRIMLVFNELDALRQQEGFWIDCREYHVRDDFRWELDRDIRDLHKRAEKMDDELDLRWGVGRRGLAKVSEGKSHRVKQLEVATKEAVEKRLVENRGKMLDEIISTRATGPARDAIVGKWIRKTRDECLSAIRQLELTHGLRD
jgi:hypothetical protein